MKVTRPEPVKEVPPVVEKEAPRVPVKEPPPARAKEPPPVKTPEPAPPKEEKKPAGAMSLTSSAFGDGKRIPKEFTCDGANLPPPLAWTGAPEGTKSFALIFDDPDAPTGTWVHWVLWGLPEDTADLSEGVRLDTHLPGGAKQGLNSWHRPRYEGPCPPSGKPHRYYFKLYALDTVITLPDGADKNALERAMIGHILEVGQYMGRFGR
jgi:Raf kinase inhibitor-like YbhB/YbcL family protein